MYYRIRETHSVAYLNDKEYVNNELKTLDTNISKIKDHINNKNNDSLSDIPKYKSASSFGEKNIEERYYSLAIYQL